MDARSPNSGPKTAALPATSSPASEDGPTPSNLLAGIQLDLFGRDPAPANPSPSQGKALEPATSDTSGPYGATLSPSTALQLSLENRLRANLGVNGSLESELTWKSWAMQSGPPICALRASTRRTVDNDFIGWPTPDTVAIGDGMDFETQRLALLARRERTKVAVKEGKTKPGSGRSMSLQMAAQSTQDMIPFTGWSTPCVVEPSTLTPRPSRAATGRNTDYLGRQVHQVEGVVSWQTPVVNDATGSQYSYSGGNHDKPFLKLPGQAKSVSAISGMTTTSPSAPRSTGQPGQGALNPELCRWLQGFPIGWGLSKDTETP
jgi:hypothetical protein